jgi:hypothetical protein
MRTKLVLSVFALAALRAFQAGSCAAHGPSTTPVNLALYRQVRHVSQAAGSDQAGDGSSGNPWATVRHAVSQIGDASVSNAYAVLVAAGTYTGGTILMKPYVDIYGGFDPATWSRDIFAHRSVLDGRGQYRVAVGADDAVLDGFTVTGGTAGGGLGMQFLDTTGLGGGVLCEGTSPVITNNVFTGNATTTPVPWNPSNWHEVANDGGAVSCVNYASPRIENNIFTGNTTEVGRGPAVAVNRYSSPRVAHNVIMENRAGGGSDRSGDGGGVSIYDYSDPEVVDNVILNNSSGDGDDGGGIFVAEWCSPLIQGNFIVDNSCGDDGGGLFFGGYKHVYDGSDPENNPVMPPISQYLIKAASNVIMANTSAAGNSNPMRVTMKSRALFTGNIVAENGSTYFQKSEITVINNTFVDRFYYTDDNPEIDTAVLLNNIFDGGTSLEADNVEKSNYRDDPAFVDDGLVVDGAATYDPVRYVTTIQVPGAGLEPGELAGRVAVASSRWTVIESNTRDSVTAWGDVSGSLVVRPSYRLSASSACIDTGSDVEGEPLVATLGAAQPVLYDLAALDVEGQIRPDPSYNLMDIGADEYGSVHPQDNSGDFNRDGVVNFLDFAQFVR